MLGTLNSSRACRAAIEPVVIVRAAALTFIFQAMSHAGNVWSRIQVSALVEKCMLDTIARVPSALRPLVSVTRLPLRHLAQAAALPVPVDVAPPQDVDAPGPALDILVTGVRCFRYPLHHPYCHMQVTCCCSLLLKYPSSESF